MRANSTISILSAAGGEKIAVPITVASRRRWKLMEEDSITLYFNLAEPVDFGIGDYIVDEVFGRFSISEEPVPADYDPLSGAYKYTLRFDADWICWKNYVLMLTYNGARKETSWVLTDTLENHLAVVIQNLTAVGYTGYSINADANTIPDKGKAVCMSYSGTSILDALKALAEAYKCEFWMDGKVVRFGKCETGEPVPLSMTNEGGRTINVENMVPTRNDSEYGNRFFAYGSTKNLPETYRKHLSFKADTTSRIGGYTAFKDPMRPMFPDFLKRSIVQASNPTQHSYEDDWLDYSYTEEEDHDEMTTWKNIRVEKTTNPISVVRGWPFTITPYNSPYGSFQYTVYIYDQGGNLLASSTNVLTPLAYTIPEGVDKITVRYSWEDATHLHRPAPLPPTVEWLDNTEYAYFAMVSYSGGTFLVRLMDGWFRAVSSRTGAVTYTNPPSGFTTNTEYTLLATGDDPIKVASIPYSYYTDDDDTTDSVRVLGERRLMLPRPPYTDSNLIAIQGHIENGYVQRESLSRDEIVERVVFFDEIYPRCALRITQVDVGEYANDTTYSDGSVKIANLPSYTLRAQLVTRNGDVAFPFDPETMMVVGKLTATFLTPDEAKVYSGRVSENACSLMGMTFDVACNRSAGVTTYQLVWNSDYGEKLPNEILMPKVGDCFILAGWNPAAMASLGLIDTAEKELALTADRYAELLEEAQFTFECHMMSDWVLSQCHLTHVPFITSEGEVFTDSNGNVYRVVGPYDTEGLFPMGQKVIVHHGALSADKETRVIAFEYKLDIPFDTPVYTVGETEAYSRLREIEKSLNAQSWASAANGSTSVNITSSQSAAGRGAPLDLTVGTMSGMSPIDYDGGEEKTFRVPSVLDHLADSDKVPRIAQTAGGDKVLVDKDGNEVAGKQFFELVVDVQDPTKYSVKLKPEYTGLWAEGWVASGGVGSQSGGGGISFLKELSDVYHDGSGVLRANGSDAVVGDALVYSGPALGWVAAAQSGGISSVVLSAGSADGTLKLTVDGVAGSDVSVPGLGSFAYKNSLSASDIPSLNYLPLSGGELSGDLRLKGSSNYGRTIRFGDGDYAYIKEDTDDHFKIYAANGIELSTGSSYDVTINGVPLDWFTVVTINNSPTLKLNPRYAGLWADGWVAAGGAGSGSSGGGSYYAGTGINIDSNNYISIKTASTSQLGGVKVDGTTITINNGVISAVGGGGGSISSVSLASGTNNGTLKLTVDGTVTDNIAVKGLGSLAYKSSLVASDIPSLDYLPLSGGELSGDLRLKGSSNYGRRLRFGDGDYVYLYENTDDHLKIYADRGLELSTGSGYGITTSNYIDIGNARLIYDDANNALHITNKSGTSLTIGLYADGFIAAGGVA